MSGRSRFTARGKCRFTAHPAAKRKMSLLPRGITDFSLLPRGKSDFVRFTACGKSDLSVLPHAVKVICPFYRVR